MFSSTKTLILASASPRRQAYLREFGIDFHIGIANIDESPRDNESALDYVARMAEVKYSTIALENPQTWVLAADTIVYLDDEILGKPQTIEDAERVLMRLSGKTHDVATAFCLGCLEQQKIHCQTVVSRVVFGHYSKDTAVAYINTGEPFDKAGAYGIQGKGAALVEELHGSYSNVVGLPLGEVLALLEKYGIVRLNC